MKSTQYAKTCPWGVAGKGETCSGSKSRIALIKQACSGCSGLQGYAGKGVKRLLTLLVDYIHISGIEMLFQQIRLSPAYPCRVLHPLHDCICLVIRNFRVLLVAGLGETLGGER